MTEAQLLEAVYAELAGAAGPEDALTTKEWAKAMGVSVPTARKRIGTLVEAGKMERVQVPRTSPMSGVSQPVRGYRLLT